MVDFVSVDGFRTLLVRVSASNQVGLVQLNRPRQGNAMTLAMAEELVRAFKMLDTNADVAVVMLAGSGKHFCTGLDLGTMQSITAELFGAQSQCPAQTRLHFLEVAKQLQDACGCLERCSKPVIAVVHGACVGAGMDLICAADLRVCAPEATFCVKEIDLAITADLGTLQRLPFIVGAGRASLMALTACNIAASTALSYGLVTGVLQAGGHVLEQGLQHAAAIAAKPRIAAMGTKRALLRARHEQSIEDGLTNVAQWNASMLWSNELQGVLSKMQKRSKL